MSTRTLVGVSAASVATLALAACGGGGDASSTPEASADTSSTSAISVANVISGPLGDQGFFDDAARGMTEIEAAGNTIQNIQADADNPAQWRTNLESVSSGDWDIVITGTSQMADILDETAAKFPDQSYIIYDAEVDQPNVASIVYRQNEGSFLAGVLAAQVTLNVDDFPRATGDKIVGVVGGQDIPVINDFVVGFEKGVESVDPSIEVLVSYIGDFVDANRGFDQAKAMYDQGADVVFQVAGGAGLGVLRAAEDADRYAIGVDSNQNQLYPGHILASMLKNIGASLKLAVDSSVAGTLAYGETTEYGLADGGVRLDFADNEGIVPQEIQDEIDGYAQQVIDGEIEVPSTY